MALRARLWCFTLNNYTESDIKCLLNNKIFDYIGFGKEIAPTTGTPHLQGFVYVKNKISFKTLAKHIPRAHLKKCDGSAGQNLTYTSKDGEYYEAGHRPTPGERNDINNVREILRDRPCMRDISDNDAINLQGIRLAQIWLSYNEKERDFKPHVEWYWGPTGSGKTRTAYENAPGAWKNNDTLQWWDGYDGHENVIIDDFRGDHCKFAYLLRILDRYGVRVPVKGGFRQLLAKKMIITSSLHPSQVYKNRTDEDINQLLRRIDVINYFGQKCPEVGVILDPTTPGQAEENKILMELLDGLVLEGQKKVDYTTSSF